MKSSLTSKSTATSLFSTILTASLLIALNTFLLVFSTQANENVSAEFEGKLLAVCKVNSKAVHAVSKILDKQLESIVIYGDSSSAISNIKEYYRNEKSEVIEFIHISSNKNSFQNSSYFSDAIKRNILISVENKKVLIEKYTFLKTNSVLLSALKHKLADSIQIVLSTKSDSAYQLSCAYND